MKPKIGIVGAGNVGATIAHLCLMKGLGDIYMLDLNSDMAQGKALDMSQSKYLFSSDITIEGGGDYEKITDCDYIIITAGLARKPGMTRDDLLNKNFEIIKEVALKIKTSKKNPFVIVVSNPLDVMAYSVFKLTGFDKKKVIGMAGILDSYRFMHYLQQKISVSGDNINTMILGSHGDTMVPLLSKTLINGKPARSLFPEAELTTLANKARNGGAEIVALLKTGSAYYAPAASTVKMLDAIIYDRKITLPCSVFPDGAYGLTDLFIGLPVTLGNAGVEEITDFKLTPEEQTALEASAKAIKEQLAVIKDKF